LTFICHHWPGITPWNVWDLDVSEWLLFAMQADVELKAIREANNRR
jgi:hypothetical protein